MKKVDKSEAAKLPQKTEGTLLDNENKLQYSYYYVRSLIEASHDPFVTINVDGEITDVNTATENATGLPRKTLIGTNFSDYFTEPKKAIIGYQKVFEQGKIINYPLTICSTSNKLMDVLYNASLYRDEQRNILGVFATARDITEIKQKEEKLLKNQYYLSKAQEIGSLGIWELDIQKNILKWTDENYKIFGVPLGTELTYELFLCCIHPDDRDFVNEKWSAGLRNEPYDIEHRIIVNDKVKWIREKADIQFDSKGKPIMAIGFCQDITKRKQVELELIENEKRLRQLNIDKDRFISILGHDLRSPFHNLLGLSGLLSKNIHKYDIDKIENLATNINKSAQSSFNLLDNLLNWARAQQGNIPFNPVNPSLTDICNDVLIILNPTANAKTIVINCLAEDNLNIFADIDMLKAVLRNLVSNAIKFTNNGGAININAEQTDSNVTISVSDNGIGIAPDDLKKLFDISEVLTTKGTAEETGTGLGLLLCKEFVEKHGGKIWVESEVGKGSDFKFTLPNNLRTG
jgi:PAS domain S-box-containing protein